MLIFAVTIIFAVVLLIFPFPLSPRIRRQEAMRGHSSDETRRLLEEACLALEQTIDRELLEFSRH